MLYDHLRWHLMLKSSCKEMGMTAFQSKFFTRTGTRPDPWSLPVHH